VPSGLLALSTSSAKPAFRRANFQHFSERTIRHPPRFSIAARNPALIIPTETAMSLTSLWLSQKDELSRKHAQAMIGLAGVSPQVNPG
jgi:hypothetical protein